jgi:RNA polymerase sigma factor (SigM family)
MNLLFHCLSISTTAQATRQTLELEQLYRDYYAPLLRYLERMCGSPELAEELVQETFIKAYIGLLTFRGECSVTTWLFRIARNLYLNSLRRPSPSAIKTDQLLAIPDNGKQQDPVYQADLREQRDRISLLLAQLPERQRSVLLLRDLEGLSYLEIAGVLDISLSAVKVSLFRARNSFRNAFLELEEGDLDG